jgi:hypothetical protein
MNEKYPKELIRNIAGSIDCGMICFVNTETFEMEDVPALLINDPEEFEGLVGETAESMGLKYPDWEHYKSIEPLDSNESFQMMEDFTVWMPDRPMKQQLSEALKHRKPFANFKQMVDDSNYRQDWFDFKKKYLENHVKSLLDLEFDGDEELDFEEINGFYDDDGNKIDPDSVPIRSMCVICKKHHADDWEENLLCLMNRFDQRDDEDFKCGAFEKI